MKRVKEAVRKLMILLSSVSKGALYLITLIGLPVLLVLFLELLAEGKYEALLPISVMSGVMCYISTNL